VVFSEAVIDTTPAFGHPSSAEEGNRLAANPRSAWLEEFATRSLDLRNQVDKVLVELNRV
jgi:hypothetical protein